MIFAVNTLNFFADTGMLILIWMVQLIIYPSFHIMDKQRFKRWHAHYIQSISYIVIPLMVLQASTLTLQLIRSITALRIIAALGVMAAWVVTFTRSVPCHARLEQTGNHTALVQRLVQTNWLRTVAWSVVFLAELIARFFSL